MAGDIHLAEGEFGLRVFRVKGLGQYAWLGIYAWITLNPHAWNTLPYFPFGVTFASTELHFVVVKWP